MPESIPDKPDGNTNAGISALRLAIDEIDEKILDFINRRLLLAKQIGGLKKQDGLSISDPKREKKIIERLLKKNNGPLGGDCLRQVFAAIMAEGRNVQKADRTKND